LKGYGKLVFNEHFFIITVGTDARALRSKRRSVYNYRIWTFSIYKDEL
jgi:hypothetical protein